MSTTPLPASFSPDAVAAMRARLGETRQSVTILFAIESGSRAWGFPSPDSDYDCRFVYVHSIADHLVLQQPRDVIEYPIIGDIDVGGWDLRKALLLALSGNAVVVEWAKSQIVYEEQPGFRDDLIALLEHIVDPVRVSHHYLGLARSHVDRLGALTSDIKLKKLFYLLRPIVALDWMAVRGFDSLPPMSLPDCMAQAGLPADVRDEIEAMIARKALTRELGLGPVPPVIAGYLETRYAHHVKLAPQMRHDSAATDERRVMAERFYRRTVFAFDRLAPPAISS